MSKNLLATGKVLAALGVIGMVASLPAQGENMMNWMNPSKWFKDNDRYYDRGYGYGPGYGGWGGPGYGWGGYPGYGGWGGPGYGWGGYPGYGGWGAPGYGAPPSTSSSAPPPPPVPQ